MSSQQNVSGRMTNNNDKNDWHMTATGGYQLSPSTHYSTIWHVYTIMMFNIEPNEGRTIGKYLVATYPKSSVVALLNT